MNDYTDDEDYQEFANDLIEPFSDAHDDDVALEAILLKVAGLYGPLDHLIFDDDDGEQETVALTFDYRTRTFSRAAVRRVAPDRETLAQALYALHPYSPSYPHSIGRPLRWNELAQGRIDKARADADTLLASGVLGIPADQRTADRETILDLIRTWASEDPSEEVYADLERLTDAVLAVLVPADQVRAETLEAVSWERMAETSSPAAVRDMMRARAAEYRKAAGA